MNIGRRIIAMMRIPIVACWLGSRMVTFITSLLCLSTTLKTQWTSQGPGPHWIHILSEMQTSKLMGCVLHKFLHFININTIYAILLVKSLVITFDSSFVLVSNRTHLLFLFDSFWKYILNPTTFHHHQSYYHATKHNYFNSIF
jgi:hypothetical protein